MKRFIDIHIPISRCNLACHYCYVGQTGGRNSEVSPFLYSSEQIGNALSQERLGGLCHFNMCGIGETLLPNETVEIARELLKHGHYVMIVTNGTITKRFRQFAEFPLEYRKRLGFKFSFHYLEFQNKGLMDHFFNNIDLVRKAGMSFSLELTPTDELEPYIGDIKDICFKRVGALCHVTIPRNESKMGIELLSRHTFDKFCSIWDTFDSAMFSLKRSVWGEKRTEFCYAGIWSGLLNAGNGIMNACYRSGIEQNIMEDLSKPIDFVAVGKHCRLPHCFNSHSLLGLGDIPEISGCTYAEERDRIDRRDGSHWLTAEMREFLSGFLYEENSVFTEKEKKVNDKKRIVYVRKSYINMLREKIRNKLAPK